MKRLLATIILVASSAAASFSQSSRSAGGIVIDMGTQKPMEYIAVYFKNTAVGCVTNYDGEFFLKGPASADTLVVEAIGYEKKFIKLNQTSNPNLRYTSNRKTYS